MNKGKTHYPKKR